MQTIFKHISISKPNNSPVEQNWFSGLCLPESDYRTIDETKFTGDM